MSLIATEIPYLVKIGLARDFTSGDEMREAYRKIRRRFMPEQPRVVLPAPIAPIVQSDPPEKSPPIDLGNAFRETAEDKFIPLIDIIRATSAVCNLPVPVIRSEGRTKSFVHARFVFIMVAHLYSGRSTTVIGRFCGGRDHSTVIHAIQRVKASPEVFSDDIRSVCETLGVDMGWLNSSGLVMWSVSNG